MKYLTGFTIALTVILFTSCVEHEVIPAPEPKVDLPVSFSANLQGAPYELIKDVDGYFCDATQAKEILPTPQPSKIIYYSSIKSDQKLDFVKIGLGKLNFNADANIDPALDAFTAFFNNNTNPDFKANADGGVEIIYRDSQGGVWISDENSTLPQDFTFTSLVQESDENGDYMKFTANFNVSLVDDLITPTDTIVFENALFEGYFKR
ncbi:hypothetical protein CW751_00530 [Brumimicrobium salinarum]|uniref:Uncharacterized protein n=1 Tax=Brumimicrobium salinarum TaxID=2058658 RepID=A0A2I0R5J6_9FLAO|nr:hypothetical protein [Brumimicrobium salinarum]PKR81858.1 hypothetical protein CW751_00530 [Brumimicrobium salinarum]